MPSSNTKPGPAVYRVALNLPREDAPGAGLPTYMLTSQLPGRTLVTTRTRSCRFRPLPDHVTLECHKYTEVELGRSSGPRRLAKMALKGAGFVAFFLKSLPGMIRFKPDITHIHTPVPFLHGLFGRYFMRIPLCITLHGSEIIHLQKSRFWRWVVRRADHVFYVSNQMGETLSAFMPAGKISYLPNGVNTGRFSPGGAGRRPVVAMVGSLRWQKDYPTALEAFQKFSRDYPSWTLRIAGRGALLDDLRSLVDDLGIAGRVEFLGVQSREQVARLLREARVFLLSSASEGFPKVLLEAAASGTPSVVTDVGDCSVVGRLTGYVVPEKSSAKIAEALGRLAGNPSEWKRISRQARDLAMTYTWESRTNRVLNVYNDLLMRGGRVAVPAGPAGGVRTPEST